MLIRHGRESGDRGPSALWLVKLHHRRVVWNVQCKTYSSRLFGHSFSHSLLQPLQILVNESLVLKKHIESAIGPRRLCPVRTK